MVEKVKKDHAVNFMLPLDDFKAIAKQAAKQERSMAYVMREIVATHLSKTREKA